MDIKDLIIEVMDNMPIKQNDQSIKIMEQRYENIDLIIKETLPQKIKEILEEDSVRILGYTGIGIRAYVPWIGIHGEKDLREKGIFDTSAKLGVDVAILFNVEGDGVALSIQQGIAKDDNKSKFKTNKELEELVSKLRLNFNKLNNVRRYEKYEIFSSKNLQIIPTTNLDVYGQLTRPKKYQIANIMGKEYNKNNLHELESDLKYLVNIYMN